MPLGSCPAWATIKHLSAAADRAARRQYQTYRRYRTSAFGTLEKCRNVRASVATEGKPDVLCSACDVPIVTRSRDLIDRPMRRRLDCCRQAPVPPSRHRIFLALRLYAAPKIRLGIAVR